MSDEVIEELCRIKDDMARPAADLRHRLQEEGRRIVDLHALRESGQRQLAPRSVPSRRGVPASTPRPPLRWPPEDRRFTTSRASV